MDEWAARSRVVADAAHLVLAVPPRPLREVPFDPVLPLNVATMIEGLYGSVDHHLRRYETLSFGKSA